jgi:hypothetical protein
VTIYACEALQAIVVRGVYRGHQLVEFRPATGHVIQALQMLEGVPVPSRETMRGGRRSWQAMHYAMADRGMRNGSEEKARGSDVDGPRARPRNATDPRLQRSWVGVELYQGFGLLYPPERWLTAHRP